MPLSKVKAVGSYRCPCGATYGAPGMLRLHQDINHNGRRNWLTIMLDLFFVGHGD